MNSRLLEEQARLYVSICILYRNISDELRYFLHLNVNIYTKYRNLSDI